MVGIPGMNHGSRSTAPGLSGIHAVPFVIRSMSVSGVRSYFKNCSCSIRVLEMYDGTDGVSTAKG